MASEEQLAIAPSAFGISPIVRPQDSFADAASPVPWTVQTTVQDRLVRTGQGSAVQV